MAPHALEALGLGAGPGPSYEYTCSPDMQAGMVQTLAVSATLASVLTLTLT